jgi:hypothetical protein
MSPRLTGLVLALLLGLVSTGKAQSTLDLIPPDALGAFVFRDVAALHQKGEKFIKESGLDPRFRPSGLIPLAYLVLGINQASVDESKPIAIVVVNPKVVDPQANDHSRIDTCLGVILPFTDIEKMAANFDLKKDDLKPGKIIPTKKQPGVLSQEGFCTVKGSNLYLGLHEKTVQNLLSTKGLAAELTPVQRRLMSEADVILHLGTQGWGHLWKEFLRDFEKNLSLTGDEKERESAKEFLEALGSVRFGLAGLRVEKGLGLSLLSVFPKEGNEAAKKFLTTFRGGDGASSLRSLPEGNVVALQAARGDGTKNAVMARVFFRALVQQLLEPGKFFGVGDRPALLNIFSEIWQRLRGSRLALYRTADASELGLFSAIAILDTEDPKEFFDEMKQLARLGSADGIDLKTEAGKKASEGEIEQLIKDLGHRRFNVRESATTKLELAGEPVLPYLEKALRSPDLETSRRAERIKREIVKAAEASRKELLSGELMRGVKPSFAFLDKVEKVGGHEVRQIAVKLPKRDLAVAGPLGKLFGPDWNRVRVAIVGKRIVLLVGSDLGLLKSALVNVAEDKPGLATSKLLADQEKKTDPGRKIELHASAQMVAALAAAGDLETPAKLPAHPPLTSLALAIEPDRLQVDVWVPLEEVKVIMKLFGW